MSRRIRHWTMPEPNDRFIHLLESNPKIVGRLRTSSRISRDVITHPVSLRYPRQRDYALIDSILSTHRLIKRVSR